MKRLALLMPFLLIQLIGAAQDVQQVAKSPWFKPSGNLSLQASFYDTDNPNVQQDRFFWSLNGNFTTTVKTVSIPFTISLNKRQSSYTLPFNQLRSFNQFGMSPTYKNFTVHAGNRSLTFSPYTLAGQTFLGGGFEWHNNKNTLLFRTFGGQFAKADLSGQAFALPFNRFGYGAQVATEGATSIAATYLHFWDEAAPADSSHTPQTNQVIGIKGAHDFNDRVSLSADVNISSYMSSLAPNINASSPLTAENSPEKSTFSAAEFQLQRSGDKVQTGIVYRRIAPGYQTMGAPYVNNDMEDLTGQLATQIWKSKVSISGSIGAQRNNLNNHLNGTQLRTIGSTRISWRISQRINYSINAANYTVNPSRVLLYEIDSMQLYQVNSNINQSGTYVIRKTETLHSFVLNHGYQTASTVTDYTTFNNVMLAYTGSHKSSNWQWTLSLTYFEGELSGTSTEGYSPMVSLGTRILKSKVAVRGTYAYQQRNTTFQESTQLASGSVNYQHKKQSIGLSTSWLDRNSTFTAREELRVNLNYNIQL